MNPGQIISNEILQLKTTLIQAYHVEVLEYSCDDYGLLYVKKFASKKSNNAFYYDPPTNISFGGGGLTPDPYEAKNIFSFNIELL